MGRLKNNTGKEPEGSKRSSLWPKVRKEHLKANPVCAVCGAKTELEVHHVKPFHTHPQLELEPTNLITLCENAKYGIVCHLLIGHLGDYTKINKNCRRDAKSWSKKLSR